jgi:hypothetical protein
MKNFSEIPPHLLPVPCYLFPVTCYLKTPRHTLHPPAYYEVSKIKGAFFMFNDDFLGGFLLNPNCTLIIFIVLVVILCGCGRQNLCCLKEAADVAGITDKSGCNCRCGRR